MPFKAYVIALLAVSTTLAATVALSNPCCAAVDEYSMTSKPAPTFVERPAVRHARHPGSANHTVAVRN